MSEQLKIFKNEKVYFNRVGNYPEKVTVPILTNDANTMSVVKSIAVSGVPKSAGIEKLTVSNGTVEYPLNLKDDLLEGTEIIGSNSSFDINLYFKEAMLRKKLHLSVVGGTATPVLSVDTSFIKKSEKTITDVIVEDSIFQPYYSDIANLASNSNTVMGKDGNGNVVSFTVDSTGTLKKASSSGISNVSVPVSALKSGLAVAGNYLYVLVSSYNNRLYRMDIATDTWDYLQLDTALPTYSNNGYYPPVIVYYDGFIYLASTTQGGPLYKIDVNTGTTTYLFALPDSGYVGFRELVVTTDGKGYIVISGDGVVTIVDLSNNTYISQPSSSLSSTSMSGTIYNVCACSLHNEGIIICLSSYLPRVMDFNNYDGTIDSIAYYGISTSSLLGTPPSPYITSGAILIEDLEPSYEIDVYCDGVEIIGG